MRDATATPSPLLTPSPSPTLTSPPPTPPPHTPQRAHKASLVPVVSVWSGAVPGKLEGKAVYFLRGAPPGTPINLAVAADDTLLSGEVGDHSTLLHSLTFLVSSVFHPRLVGLKDWGEAPLDTVTEVLTDCAAFAGSVEESMRGMGGGGAVVLAKVGAAVRCSPLLPTTPYCCPLLIVAARCCLLYLLSTAGWCWLSCSCSCWHWHWCWRCRLAPTVVRVRCLCMFVCLRARRFPMCVVVCGRAPSLRLTGGPRGGPGCRGARSHRICGRPGGGQAL